MTRQAARQGQQQAITDDQAERAVDALEAIDADQHDDRLLSAGMPGLRHGDLQPVQEQLAVRAGWSDCHGRHHEPAVPGRAWHPSFRG